MTETYVTDEGTGKRMRLSDLSRNFHYKVLITTRTTGIPARYSYEKLSVDGLKGEIGNIEGLGLRVRDISVNPVASGSGSLR